MTEAPFKISPESICRGMTNLAVSLYETLVEEGHHPEAAREAVVYFLRSCADNLEAAPITPSNGEGE